MAKWVEDQNGNHVNLDFIFKVTANDLGGGTFKLYGLLLNASGTTSEDYVVFDGSWSSLNDAREAFRRLAGSADPSTYGDLD